MINYELLNICNIHCRHRYKQRQQIYSTAVVFIFMVLRGDTFLRFIPPICGNLLKTFISVHFESIEISIEISVGNFYLFCGFNLTKWVII